MNNIYGDDLANQPNWMKDMIKNNPIYGVYKVYENPATKDPNYKDRFE